ncbi:MAG: phospholipid carrier-dependent glycosyltransferase [Nitrospiraceae bacterium]|nr:phospholipid carrier-dependent glycosyltransferase [Nitrospiraceae bacterium]
MEHRHSANPLLRAASFLVPAAVLIFFVWVGYRGIDFGSHWDETQQVDSVRESFRTGTLLPQMYNYPSVTYYLTLSRLLPDIWATVRDVLSSDIGYGTPVRKEILTPGTGTMTENDFLLQVRSIFIVVTLLSVIWTYLLALLWRKSRLQAFIAAALLGSSWEVSYHARWIAPDGILMQFGVLTVLFLIASMESPTRSRFWLRCAACAAGVACGTKYPGGVMLLPALLTYAYLRKRAVAAAAPRTWTEYPVLVGLFCLSFFISTPGALLQPVYFVYEVKKQMAIYRAGWWSSTVHGGPEHFILNVKYLSLVLFSHYWPIALFFSLMVLPGAVSLGKDGIPRVAIFLSAPVIWLLYLSGQNVMAVRNLLLIAPFMAVLSAEGIGFCGRILKKSAVRTAFLTAVFGLLVLNAAWLVHAADTIRTRTSIDYRRSTYDYLKGHPGATFLLSDGVRNLLPGSAGAVLNVSSDPGKAQEFVFLSNEPFHLKLIGNRRGRYSVIAGDYDVNFDYYPLWMEPKVVAITVPEAKEMSLLPAGP